mmetsp:Transcript_18135/g.38978  ORF Transcript_18135/g.38978 Transcript_18135/m.38978 type:complete len:107 (-) Transcript_18135:16-336(-)
MPRRVREPCPSHRRRVGRAVCCSKAEAMTKELEDQVSRAAAVVACGPALQASVRCVEASDLASFGALDVAASWKSNSSWAASMSSLTPVAVAQAVVAAKWRVAAVP